MGECDRAVQRTAVLHLDRHRHLIEAEVHRRLGRAEPLPFARAEVVRRFRSFCRLASVDVASARPSLDGLGGNSAAALERALHHAVDAACECGASEEIQTALRDLAARFCAGIRRIMQPSAPEQRERRGRRKRPNAGRRVRSAIDRINDAYLALCLETGRLHDMNPAAEALFGTEAATLLEREFVELINPTHRAKYRDLEARLDAGEAAGPIDLVFRRPEGTAISAEVTIASHTIGGRRLAILIAREKLRASA